MGRLPMIFSGITGAAGRISGLAGQVLQDRLELLALEMREAKVRFVQALLLTYLALVFSLLGLLLLVFTGLYLVPQEWRVYSLAVAAAASFLTGWAFFVALYRHFTQKPLAFEQTLAELKKDARYFSTGE
jgi:uncharacterized membrane protein YqjE